MKKLFLTLCCVALLAGCKNNQSAPRFTLIDDDWQFSRDSIAWNSVDLPHDWSIAGPYAQAEPANNDGAYLPTGLGYYKKTLNLPHFDPDKKYRLYFEGVYQQSQVWANGHLAGGHPYGYSSFFVDITPYVQAGDNELVVSVDNSQQRNCRWYTGSGIYRHVWLEQTDRLHLDPWSMQITTQGGVNGKPAQVNVRVDIVNEREADTEREASVEIYDGEELVASAQQLYKIPAGDTLNIAHELKIDSPKLWDTASPHQYLAVIKVADDKLEENFGVRTFEWSPLGLTLNGEPLKLNGACVHHDNGVLGAASYDAAEVRKVKLLKEAGFNALRCSHNVPAPAFLDACDSLGMIVIDEAFDGWAQRKTEHDYADLIDAWWQADIDAMVLRDRNHPSVLAWSVGNEVLERKEPQAVAIANKLGSRCRELDPTRPVTSALAAWDDDWEIYDSLAGQLDITGYNYMIHKAEGDHERVPERVMWQTESYPRDAFSNWRMAQEHDYVLGDFVWTGLDYLGESGIGRHYYDGDPAGEHWERSLWPWHGAYCGDVDITGYRKPISHYRDMLWNGADTLYMAVREPNGYFGEIRETLWGTYPTVESWCWPGWEGKPIEIEIYSLLPHVTVSLNGDDVPVNETPCIDNGYKIAMTLPYAPGVLEVTARDDNEIVKTVSLATPGTPYAIKLTADRPQYAAHGQDLAFVIAEVVDKQGQIVPTATNELQFEVTGAGTLLASGNADMKDTEPYVTPKAKAWRGRAIAVVKADAPGDIRITVKSESLLPDTLSLRVK